MVLTDIGSRIAGALKKMTEATVIDQAVCSTQSTHFSYYLAQNNTTSSAYSNLDMRVEATKWHQKLLTEINLYSAINANLFCNR